MLRVFYFSDVPFCGDDGPRGACDEQRVFSYDESDDSEGDESEPSTSSSAQAERPRVRPIFS